MNKSGLQDVLAEQVGNVSMFLEGAQGKHRRDMEIIRSVSGGEEVSAPFNADPTTLRVEGAQPESLPTNRTSCKVMELDCAMMTNKYLAILVAVSQSSREDERSKYTRSNT